MNINKSIDIIILLSGGIDSMACIQFFLDEGAKITALFCNYGQVSLDKELASARAIANYYNIELNIVNCEGLPIICGGEIIGRNSFLLNIALFKLQKRSAIIAIGIHSDTTYIDCTKIFMERMQSVFDLYSNGSVIISAPFLHWTKQEIWDYCVLKAAPLNLTYSCELGERQPCGRCDSCKDLEVLYGEAK